MAQIFNSWAKYSDPVSALHNYSLSSCCALMPSSDSSQSYTPTCPISKRTRASLDEDEQPIIRKNCDILAMAASGKNYDGLGGRIAIAPQHSRMNSIEKFMFFFFDLYNSHNQEKFLQIISRYSSPNCLTKGHFWPNKDRLGNHFISPLGIYNYVQLHQCDLSRYLSTFFEIFPDAISSLSEVRIKQSFDYQLSMAIGRFTFSGTLVTSVSTAQLRECNVDTAVESLSYDQVRDLIQELDIFEEVSKFQSDLSLRLDRPPEEHASKPSSAEAARRTNKLRQKRKRKKASSPSLFLSRLHNDEQADDVFRFPCRLSPSKHCDSLLTLQLPVQLEGLIIFQFDSQQIITRSEFHYYERDITPHFPPHIRALL